MSLQDQVAIITGATGESGRAIARKFAHAGVRLVLVGTNGERLNHLAAELALPPEKTLMHIANVHTAEAVHGLATAVDEKFGRVDIVLNLVGGWVGGKTIPDFESSQTEEMLQQHLWTTWHLAQTFVPKMQAAGWGRIAVISSPAATQGAANSGPYAIAKAAQDALLMTLAQELRGTNVTVNLLQVRSIDIRPEHDRIRTPGITAGTTPDEIAAAFLYLCSDEAQSVNGARIPMFGV